LIFLSPLLSLLFIRRFVGEEILPATLVGLALIVGGIVWQRVGWRGRQREGGATGRTDKNPEQKRGG
ncbi:MAG: hypothetical protein JXA57_13760, partial [Armatimonadetes bacterium]|nr:hypothetical protein [Armatimonadota bacterium]